MAAQRTVTKINIIARDFEATLAFYRLAGVEIPEVLTEPAGTAHAPARNGDVSLALDNPELARIYSAEWRLSQAPNSLLLTAQMPSRASVDETYLLLVEAGHEGLQPPYDAFWGSRYAVVKDPEGNSLGLESPPDDTRRSWPPRPSPDPPPR